KHRDEAAASVHVAAGQRLSDVDFGFTTERSGSLQEKKARPVDYQHRDARVAAGRTISSESRMFQGLIAHAFSLASTVGSMAPPPPPPPPPATANTTRRTTSSENKGAPRSTSKKPGRFSTVKTGTTSGDDDA
ncbi:unnamed protein product, partial [Laminaria digitata]